MLNQRPSFILCILFVMCDFSYGACPPLVATVTTNITCKFNDKILENCLTPIEGTKAVLSCNQFYEEDTIKTNPNRLCREGRWDGPILNCYPICGIKRPKEQMNEQNNNLLLEYPWDVRIYSSSTQQFLCSGTLIAMNLVLTAKHCIAYDEDSAAYLIGDILVGAGKYYPEYLNKRDKFQQNSQVNKIVIRNTYNGTVGFYEFDLAILMLTDPFNPSTVVQPVCIDFNKESNFEKNGFVISWDYTNETISINPMTKEIPLLFIPYNDCRTNVSENIAIYITFDKICGANLNFGTACQNNSGKGLIYKNLINDRYYIAGIGSNLQIFDKVCDFNYYGVYTSIAEHIEFLEMNIEINRIMQNCRLPSFPAHGKYVLMNQFEKLAYLPENLVPPHTILTLICNSGYNFSSLHETQFSCSSKNGQWTPTLRDCIAQLETEEVNHTYSILIAGVTVIFVIGLLAVIIIQITFKKDKKLKEKRVVVRTSLQLKINEESSFQ